MRKLIVLSALFAASVLAAAAIDDIDDTLSGGRHKRNPRREMPGPGADRV